MTYEESNGYVSGSDGKPTGPAIRVRPPGVEGRLGSDERLSRVLWSLVSESARAEILEILRENGVVPPYGYRG